MRQEISFRRDWKLSLALPPNGPLGDGHVTVRLPKPTDLEILTLYGGDASLLIGNWIGRPDKEESPREWAKNCIDEWCAGWTSDGSDLGPALIVDSVEMDVEFAGIINLHPHSDLTVELLYGISPATRGHHIASRSTRLVADWILRAGHFSRVELRIGEDHTASHHIAANAGFRFKEKFESFVAGTGKTHIDLLFEKSLNDLN